MRRELSLGLRELGGPIRDGGAVAGGARRVLLKPQPRPTMAHSTSTTGPHLPRTDHEDLRGKTQLLPRDGFPRNIVLIS